MTIWGKQTHHTQKNISKNFNLVVNVTKKSYAIYNYTLCNTTMTAWTVNFCPCTTTAWTVNFVHVCMILITGPAHFFIVVIHFNVRKGVLILFPQNIYILNIVNILYFILNLFLYYLPHTLEFEVFT